MLVARWFENRGDAAADLALPADVAALVAPYRRAAALIAETSAETDFHRRPRAPFRFGAAAREPGRVRRRLPQLCGRAAALGRDRDAEGDERLRAGRPEQAVTHRITLRYRDGVTAAMRLARGLRRFAIRSAADPDGGRRELVCLVEEITP